MMRCMTPDSTTTTETQTGLLAKYFRGFGDPIRLRILLLLTERGELTVGRIAELVGEPQPKVSHHIACLRWCGYVFTRHEGRTTFNSVRDERVVQMLDLGAQLASENGDHITACERLDQEDRDDA